MPLVAPSRGASATLFATRHPDCSSLRLLRCRAPYKLGQSARYFVSFQLTSGCFQVLYHYSSFPQAYCPGPPSPFRLDRPARIISSVMSRLEAMTALEWIICLLTL